MDSDQVSMGMAIMIIMIAIAGIAMIVFKASPEATLNGSIMKSGMVAMISIIGAGLFILSTLLFSAAATVAILMPVGLALGMSPLHLIAFYPAANSVFFLPTYGTLLAAVSFDQTGTTKIGKFLFNHSFMLPGMVTVVTAIIFALLLNAVIS